MNNWLPRLDALLRARTIEVDAEHEPYEGVSRRAMLLMAAALGAVYGMFMGWYAIRTAGLPGLAQLGASTFKVPVLFLITLAITFPSLYVFNTLMGSRLTFRTTMRVALGWITVMLAVAASLGPILGFFTISADSYVFIVLLNVLLLGVSGVVGSAALLQRLHAAPRYDDPIFTPPLRPAPVRPEPADVAHRTLAAWLIIFGVVGLQMAWVLRPFIGAPDEPFTLFRPTDGNIFHALERLVRAVMGAK